MTRLETDSDQVDGVLVHHFPRDDEITHAMLAFGVGERDEALPTQGVLHVLEHIVMDAVRHTPLEINAGVEASTTQFTVSGSPDRVADYLYRLCAALRDPPVARLAAEVPIITAELAGVERPEAPLLAARYGLRDLGASSADGPGPEGLLPLHVATAARWFVSGNAFLMLDGPRPSDLRLPLAAGPAPAHSRPEPRRWPGPHAIRVDGPACMVSVLLPPQTPDRIDRLAIELIRQRLTESVRHREGLSYLVEEMVLPSGAQHVDLLVRAEPPPDRTARAAKTLITELRSLLRDGPTADELEQANARLEELDKGREARASRVLEYSMNRLLGVVSFLPEPGLHRGTDRATIIGYLQALEPDLLFLLPTDPDIDLDQLVVGEATVEPLHPGALPAGKTFVPRLLTKVLNAEARQATVVLEQDGISQRTGAETRSIRWAGVAGLMEIDEHQFVVLGLDGTAIPIGPGLYRGGQELIAAARTHIPPSLTYRRSRLVDLSDSEH